MEFTLSAAKDGILCVDKPVGWTSFDVVAKIRGQLRAEYRKQGVQPTKRQLKVGHAGTLDPFATGLLIILLGDATSRADQFLKLDKVYEATIELGSTSTTGDPEGERTHYSTHQPTHQELTAALAQFQGTITQVPPAFSAIKVNGQRAYKLARAGHAVTLASRPVVVHQLELLAYQYPSVKIRAHVSSGTYMRTIAEDIGAHLQTGAYCAALRRLTIGDYTLDR